MEGVGVTAKGIFGGSASGGRAFRSYRRKRQMDATHRFAELLSEHMDEEDIAAGRATKLDPGGDVAKTARRMGISAQNGNAMLQRIRRKLGPQAI
jgi:hypothetical protein